MRCSLQLYNFLHKIYITIHSGQNNNNPGSEELLLMKSKNVCLKTSQQQESREYSGTEDD